MTEQGSWKKNVEIILCTSGKRRPCIPVDGKAHHPEISAVQNKSDQEAEGRVGSLWELHPQHTEPTGTCTEAPGQGTGHRNPADQGCLRERGAGRKGAVTNHALEWKPQQRWKREAARKVEDGEQLCSLGSKAPSALLLGVEP